jgi:UDP-N-acetylglucosamine acyltransferase
MAEQQEPQTAVNGNHGGAVKEESVKEENGSTDKPAKAKVQMAKTPFPDLQMPLGYEEICKILPHRYPFLLVDRITELEPGKRCVGIKNVTANEEYFLGHFPGHPVMPGVLILEAMAQVAGVLTLVSRNTPGALSYFAAIEKARFRQPVRPGDQVVTEATLEVLRGAYCKVKVEGRVDGQVVIEADYTFMTSVDASSSNPITQTATVQATQTVTTTSQRPAVASAPIASQNGNVTLKANARTAQVIPPREAPSETYIHPTALVDPDAKLDEGVWIGPFCIVESGTSIGKGTILESNVTVKRGTSLGQRCRIWPHVVLGHEPQDLKFKGEESFLRIGDDNMFREMVTIHRATGEGEATTIGNSNVLMAYVHVGHNCTIGSNNLISNSTGIAGHVTIEDKVVIGGFVGVHQFVHIGKMAMVGGVSKVVQDVPPFCMADGRPAKTHGLNIRGLRRNGVVSEERTQVANAVKLLFRSNLNTTEALERIRAEIPPSVTLEYLMNFIERVREGRLGRQDETPHL